MNITKKDYIWSYFSFILKLIVSVLMLPLVLTNLTTHEYGLWVTFTSLGSLISILDFGFANTLIRNLAYVWSGVQKLEKTGYSQQTNTGEINEQLFFLTYKTSKYIYLFISIIAFVLFNSVGFIYIRYIISDMFDTEYIIAWIIYSAGLSVNLYFTYATVVLKSIGFIAQSQKAIVYSTCSQLIISYVGLINGAGIITLAFASLIYSIIIGLISKKYIYKNKLLLSILKSKYKDVTVSKLVENFKVIFHNVKRAGISTLASMTIAQSTTIICSAYFGVEVTAGYGIGLQLLSALREFAQVPFQTTLPLFIRFTVNNDLKKCQKIFSKNIVFYIASSLMGCLVIYFFANPVLNLLQSATTINLELFLPIALYMCFEGYYSVNTTYITAKNTLPYVPSLVITSVLIVIVSIIVVNITNNVSLLLYTRFIIQAGYVFWKWPSVALKNLDMKIENMIKTGFSEWALEIKKINYNLK